MPGVMSGCGRSMWGRIRRSFFFDGPVALLRLAFFVFARSFFSHTDSTESTDFSASLYSQGADAGFLIRLALRAEISLIL